MPGADHSHLALAVVALAAGVVMTIVMLLINPKPQRPDAHRVRRVTLGAIALIIGLTGGSDSPAASLVYLLIVFQAWFWDSSGSPGAWSARSPSLLSPLIYENVLGGQTGDHRRDALRRSLDCG